jgi:hypothetical protein
MNATLPLLFPARLDLLVDGRNSSVSPVCSIRKENLQVRFVKRNDRFHHTSQKRVVANSSFSGFHDLFLAQIICPRDTRRSPTNRRRDLLFCRYSNYLVRHNRASLFIPTLALFERVSSLVASLGLFTLMLFSLPFSRTNIAEYRWFFSDNKLTVINSQAFFLSSTSLIVFN